MIYAHAGFGAQAVPYPGGWELQRRLHERRVKGEIPDTCLLLEHEAVYTAGKRTSPLDRPVTDPGIPVIDVDRGGKITWHGPGQLVGYPIVALPEPVDVIAYVRAVEEVLLRACRDVGVAATRVEGRSGVWITGAARPDRKLGAIGIRVSRGVTMHGFALNCDNDLGWYDRIVACGIQDAGTTSLSAEADRLITVQDMIAPVEQHLAGVLGATSTRRVTGASELAALAGPLLSEPVAG
ncbi:MAG: lipoyl(octanoyl) transferase LipB [Actinobacteria bacterium]|nr:lipoyl(octanoyl) transferase LipB [Actinomycetota bacterium]